MPTKNTIKTYIEGGYYHIYNRGVDKRKIFIDGKDCAVFLYYLKLYLSSPDSLQKSEHISPRMMYKILNLNLSREVDLISFALMPNHFHLQIKQHSQKGIEKLMRRALTGYVHYFNNRFERIGTLFESTYKAVLIKTDEQLLYLSSYIHRNPMKLKPQSVDFVSFSSYPYYLKERFAEWIKPEEILNYFKISRSSSLNDVFSYQSFVENFKEDPKEVLGKLTLEYDYA